MIGWAEMSWPLAAGNVLAIWLIQRNAASRVGWAFSLLWQIPWAVYAAATNQLGFIALSLAYSFVYGMGLRVRSDGQNSVPEPAELVATFDRCPAVHESPQPHGRLVTTHRCDLGNGHAGEHHIAFPINCTFRQMTERGW